MGEVTSHHIASLSELGVFDFRVGLVRPRAAPAKMSQFLRQEFELRWPADCTTSVQARTTQHGTCHKGDVVLFLTDTGVSAGMVWFHAAVLGEHVSLVSHFRFVSSNPELASAEFADDQRAELMPTSDIVTAATFTKHRPGMFRVLIPAHLRAYRVV